MYFPDWFNRLFYFVFEGVDTDFSDGLAAFFAIFGFSVACFAFGIVFTISQNNSTNHRLL
jgi:hypothetical protein